MAAGQAATTSIISHDSLDPPGGRWASRCSSAWWWRPRAGTRRGRPSPCRWVGLSGVCLIPSPKTIKIKSAFSPPSHSPTHTYTFIRCTRTPWRNSWSCPRSTRASTTPTSSAASSAAPSRWCVSCPFCWLLYTRIEGSEDPATHFCFLSGVAMLVVFEVKVLGGGGGGRVVSVHVHVHFHCLAIAHPSYVVTH